MSSSGNSRLGVFQQPRRFAICHEGQGLHAQSIRAEQTSLGATELQQPQPLTVLEARQQTRSLLDPEAHRIAGVTFEGRQEAVQNLQAGEDTL